MKRYAEAVLNGHPDKFCDLVADRLICEMYKADPNAYAQIEVSVWSDIIFLTGGAVAKSKRSFSTEEVIRKVGHEIGYTSNNHIDVARYKILDHICWITDEPKRWTEFSNDQCIVTGYAGYDELTHFLPPEHFLSWHFRDELITSINSGLLKHQGPDGKLLVTMREEGNEWKLDTVLVTIQQKEEITFIQFISAVEEVLHNAYRNLQAVDPRWTESWNDISVLINPNGPLIQAGSDGDNGQTGRKLVMDYYGPRIPIGGGALYGKDLAHVDRSGAMNARRFALDMVLNGSKEALVNVCFAPGVDEPLSINIISDKKSLINAYDFFRYSKMKNRINISDMDYKISKLGTFYNKEMSFNKISAYDLSRTLKYA